MSTPKRPQAVSLDDKLAEDHDRCCPLLHSNRMSRNSCTVMAMLRAAARLAMLEAAGLIPECDCDVCTGCMPEGYTCDVRGSAKAIRARAELLGGG